MSNPVTFERHDNVAVIKIDNPPVNALSQPVRQGIVDAVAQLRDDDALEAAALICAGRTFIAGADITEFGKPPVQPFTPDVMRTIERSDKPIVAALHGTVLGGGFETALACHYRVARKGTKVGFPEVTLGLLPGTGGTQLLPRLAGIETALDLITSGRQVAVDSDTGSTLVDVVFDGETCEEMLQYALSEARALIEKGGVAKRLADVAIEKSSDHKSVFVEWRKTMEKKKRGLLAAQYCIDSIENAVLLSFDDAIAEERRLFQECRKSSQSRAMGHAFFAERECTKIDGIDASVEALPMNLRQL